MSRIASNRNETYQTTDSIRYACSKRRFKTLSKARKKAVNCVAPKHYLLLRQQNGTLQAVLVPVWKSYFPDVSPQTCVPHWRESVVKACYQANGQTSGATQIRRFI